MLQHLEKSGVDRPVLVWSRNEIFRCGMECVERKSGRVQRSRAEGSGAERIECNDGMTLVKQGGVRRGGVRPAR